MKGLGGVSRGDRCISVDAKGATLASGKRVSRAQALEAYIPPAGGKMIAVGSLSRVLAVIGARSMNSSRAAMNVQRTNSAAVKLGGGGAILVIGGLDQTGTPLASAELFNPATGTWTMIAGALNTARYNHAAVMTANGAILVIGGQGAGAAYLSSVEIFSSGSGRPEITGAFAAAGTGLSSARANMAAALLADGRILVAGGADSGDAALCLAEIYSAGI